VGASASAATHDSATETTSHDLVVEETCQLIEPTTSTSAENEKFCHLFAFSVSTSVVCSTTTKYLKYFSSCLELSSFTPKSTIIVTKTVNIGFKSVFTGHLYRRAHVQVYCSAVFVQILPFTFLIHHVT